MKLIFLFLDGVGLATRTETNPFHLYDMPKLRDALGLGFFLEDAAVQMPSLVFKPIDSGLGCEGTGQSGTGQFSIYTGFNGAQLFGRHYGPFLPSTLRATLAQENIFKKLKLFGKKPCYANAFPDSFINANLVLREQGKIRSSVLFEAAVIEAIQLRNNKDLKEKKAVSGDIISWWWGQNEAHGDSDVPVILPEEAAENLIDLFECYDAVFFEFFLADYAGHRRIKTHASEIVSRLDAYLASVLSRLPGDALFILTSDHGNFEDNSHDRHTLNPVPLLVKGLYAEAFQQITGIHEIVPSMLSVLKNEN
ncbi:metalloenzyme domain protein [Chloroherpeton thalassium ATCC 35110]|uniref:Metalloenzyme domain protein n=1 Tax=Chloroherpeton thalassium (strain ATCC 35110 / GB-78) TaxID=517418 RepID=B3QT23_CHLT3|nr:metalloenzyme domain-containing protein [Chloroherpeton thalassium]ACF12666.1 metalloenzyme domain protein [Chloroherpeton thalassium ATCC 35110]